MTHDLRILFGDPGVGKYGGEGQRWYLLAELICGV
jgi:hypothetical protein